MRLARRPDDAPACQPLPGRAVRYTWRGVQEWYIPTRDSALLDVMLYFDAMTEEEWERIMRERKAVEV